MWTLPTAAKLGLVAFFQGGGITLLDWFTEKDGAVNALKPEAFLTIVNLFVMVRCSPRLAPPHLALVIMPSHLTDPRCH